MIPESITNPQLKPKQWAVLDNEHDVFVLSMGKIFCQVTDMDENVWTVMKYRLKSYEPPNCRTTGPEHGPARTTHPVQDGGCE
jgi:hypothetical protein